jgi:hypothetical protein
LNTINSRGMSSKSLAEQRTWRQNDWEGESRLESRKGRSNGLAARRPSPDCSLSESADYAAFAARQLVRCRRLWRSRDNISGKSSLLRRFFAGDNPHPLRGIRTNRLRVTAGIIETLRKGGSRSFETRRVRDQADPSMAAPDARGAACLERRRSARREAALGGRCRA